MLAIVPAAGQSTRVTNLGEAQTKLLVEISLGVSVLGAALNRLVRSGLLTQLVIPTRPDLIRAIELVARSATADLALPVSVVEGGVTRQASVHRALTMAEPGTRLVIVHDGARPFCPPELVREVARTAERTGAAIAAAPVKCSLKRSSDGSVIDETIPRAPVFEAQTPQCFAFDLLREAYDRAESDAYAATDDSELVERLGHRVTLVRGPDVNFKVTTDTDVFIARAFAERADRLP